MIYIKISGGGFEIRMRRYERFYLSICLVIVIILSFSITSIASYSNISDIKYSKVNVYAFDATTVSELLEYDGNWYVQDLFYIIESRMVNADNVALVIEEILTDNIFQYQRFEREYRDEQWNYYDSLFNNISFKNGILTIDYNEAGYMYLNAGTTAAILYGNEIDRTVFSCDLINVLDERYNGESGCEADHYGFGQTKRIEKFQIFLDERAVVLSSDATSTERLRAAYGEYSKIIKFMTSTYGNVDEREGMDYYDSKKTGVFKVDLVDFDNDGIPELLIAFKWPAAHDYEAVYYVYGFTNRIVQCYKENTFFGTGGGQSIDLAIGSSNKYILKYGKGRGYTSETYYKLENGEMHIALERSIDENYYTQEDMKRVVNGKDVSDNEYENSIKALNINSIDYETWSYLDKIITSDGVISVINEINEKINLLSKQEEGESRNNEYKSLGYTSGWGEEAIDTAMKYEILPDKFSKDSTNFTLPINRLEFAEIAVKVYEKLTNSRVSEVSIKEFSDTSDINVIKAYNAGIMVGNTEHEFDPYTSLNREQCATAFTRVVKKAINSNWTFENDSKYHLSFEMITLFSDDNDISNWAKESVYFMAANDIIKGIGDNLFAPLNKNSKEEESGYATATREQTLAIAVRIVDNQSTLKNVQLIYLDKE